MPIDEVFINPTVKQVIFQIRYSNLFFIGDKIGEYQTVIMGDFPESRLIEQASILYTTTGPSGDIAIPEQTKAPGLKRIWEFQNPLKYMLHISADSLDISSEVHKSYNNPAAEHRFRDFIEKAVAPFLKLTNVPILKRIGLRYVDECPVFANDKETFKEFYNSVLPINRFEINSIEESAVRTIYRNNGHSLIYGEKLKLEKPDSDKRVLVLDFDGFAQNIEASNYLKITDSLHETISEEFNKTITEKLKEYMRKPRD